MKDLAKRSDSCQRANMVGCTALVAEFQAHLPLLLASRCSNYPQTVSFLLEKRRFCLAAELIGRRLFRSGNLVFSSRNWNRDRDWGHLEDMFVFSIFLFQDFNKRQVTKLGHRTDNRQMYFSLKSKLYTLSAAKCVSLSLQVIAP